MNKIFLVVVAFLVLFLAAVLYINSPTGNIEESIDFDIVQGDSAYSIGKKLEQDGVIKNSFWFKLISKVFSYGDKYKAGTYNINKNKGTFGVARLFVEGKVKLYTLTINEGRTLSQVANIVEEMGFASKEDFILAASNREMLDSYGILGPNAQGFLYPETYYLTKPYTADKLVKKMIDTFFLKLESIYPDYKLLSKEELNSKISMAGLVEKEYRVKEEAAIMAGVFYNRLAINMKLESCASVIYVLTEELGRPHPNRLFFSDLEVESPYNVYKNYGLPPSPISNPGAVALNASFNHTTSDYLYFVVKDPSIGSHQFSKTIEEHEKGAEAYSAYISKQ